jgi:hypothetical protein
MARIFMIILGMCWLAPEAVAQELAMPADATPLLAQLKAAFSDPRAEPEMLVRGTFIATNSGRVTTADGTVYDSSQIPSSQFGYRQGFVLENAQFGLHGRFADSGFHYDVKLELVPRDKTGVPQQGNNLRDAWVGWHKYDWLDVRFGWQKVPFSQVNLKSTADMLLPYTPTFDTFTPLRQMGLTVIVQDVRQRVKVLLGIYNSNKTVSDQLTDWQQLLSVARAEVDVGRFMGNPGFRWRVAVNGAYTPKLYDDHEARMWLGADTHLRWRFIELEAETVLMQFKQQALDKSETVHTGLGWHADLTGWLLEDTLTVTGRVEQTDGDTSVEDGQSLVPDTLLRQSRRWLTLGVGYSMSAQTRCVLAATKRQALEGLNLVNDSVQATCHMAF